MTLHYNALVKNGIRIAGCYFLMTHQFVMAGVMFVVAEFVGILVLMIAAVILNLFLKINKRWH